MEEEQLVPIDTMDEFDEIWDFKEDEKDLAEEDGMDFLKWDDLRVKDEEEGYKKLKEEYGDGVYSVQMNNPSECDEEQVCNSDGVIKDNMWRNWDEEEKNTNSLSLSLNYQQVMDAWSDRGSLYSNNRMGEVPVMHEEDGGRDARVMRYKEKRQSRVLCKKIRYQVRKINADKRPRIKGRFVKGNPDRSQI